jgi:hypothetical protein
LPKTGVPETVLLADDFNDNSLDTLKWVANNLFSGFVDSAVLVSERNQRLEVGPLQQGVSGSHYNGIRSAGRFNFTGAYSLIQVLQPAATSTAADAMFTIGSDANNYYRIFVEAGNWIAQEKVNGVKSTLITVPYDATNYKYWRIRHDLSSSSVVFESRPDSGIGPVVWTQRYSKPWSASVALSAIQFELKGGTWQLESNVPGTIIFDNFRAAKPGVNVSDAP